jgi:hypothetical protein
MEEKKKKKEKERVRKMIQREKWKGEKGIIES